MLITPLAAFDLGEICDYIAQDNPIRAGTFVAELRASIGIHWGTFDGMSDESLDQAPKDLAISKKQSSLLLNFFVLKHGQRWVRR